VEICEQEIETESEVANRWTFYIGPDGKIQDIDRKVIPGSSGQDIVTRLKAMNVPAARRE